MWLQNYITIFVFTICCYDFKDVEPSATVRSKRTQTKIARTIDNLLSKEGKMIKKRKYYESADKERMKNNGKAVHKVLKWKNSSGNSKFESRDHEEKPMIQTHESKIEEISNER